MRARLKDVAAKAGVATNTASTILNKRPNSWASKETADRVFKAAKELGYTPSRAALGLRLGSFKTVGLVIPDLHNPVYTTFADLLGQRLQEGGYDLILEHSRSDVNDEKHCLESILERQIDAVIYFVSDLDSHLNYLKKAEKFSKKVVAMTGPSQEPFPFDSVEVDFSNGIVQAVEHLLDLGHQSFVFLSALAKGQQAGGRPELYKKILKDRGIPEERISFVQCLHDIKSAQLAFGAYLDALDSMQGERPTALIAMNDLSAMAAIRAAFERGIRVPKHLSVIGVDNIPMGDCLRRRLTTIGQPLEELANAAAELLLHRLKEGEQASEPMVRKFKAELILKETTAAPFSEEGN